MLDRKLWIAALRDPNNPQGRGYLKDSNGRMCCLGLGLVIAGVQHSQLEPDMPYEFGRAKSATMPSPVQCKILGIGPALVGALATINDNGGTFKEIADFLETGDGSPLETYMIAALDNEYRGLKRYRPGGKQ